MPTFTATDNTQLAVSDWGDPACRPVVLVHAWGLNGDMWGAQVPALIDAGLRPVSYDQRGHGRSDRSRGGYDLDGLADDLAAVIGTLDLRGLVLVGHSLGAAVVIRYLSRHGSQRVAGLVISGLVGPALLRRADNPTGVDEAVFEARRAAMAADIGAFVDATPPAEYFGATKTVSAALGDWTRRQIIDTPLRVLLETQRALTRADLRAELAKIELPTLVMHGSADTSAPLELTGRPAAALVPDARLVIFDSAGHGLYTSDAARYNAELIGFARGLGTS